MDTNTAWLVTFPWASGYWNGWISALVKMHPSLLTQPKSASALAPLTVHTGPVFEKHPPPLPLACAGRPVAGRTKTARIPATKRRLPRELIVGIDHIDIVGSPLGYG